MKKKSFVRVLVLIVTITLSGCGASSSITTSTEEKVSVKETDMTIVQEEPVKLIEMPMSLEEETSESKTVELEETTTDEIPVSEIILEKETVEQILPELTTELESLETQESNTIVEEERLTTTQRNSINMLNYITVLTQEINDSKENRIFLESVQSSLLNDIYPNAVDTKTQSQINNLWKTIDGYRMVSVKRERLNYIYEQNKAQALRQAVPNPLGLLSTVQSGNILEAAASVLYMAVDATTSYQSATTQVDLKYLQDGWELEKEELEELSASKLNLLNYMINMTRDNGFPGEWALNEEAIKDFVKWTNEDNLVRKISWFESNEETYKEFKTYWLEIAKCYYELNEYEKCLSAVEQYEEVSTRIFRKDYDYAEVLPMAILSAKEIKGKAEYITFAEKYSSVILSNCDEDNWALRYFVAQIYIDLYANTNDKGYFESAYQIAYENVNILVGEQEKLNIEYLNDVKIEKVSSNATKREKKEVKDYNKLLKEKRKVELPPVSEAFYLNCDLLYALAEELKVSIKDKQNIDAIVHDNGQSIFLTEALDNRYWASEEIEDINSNDINIEFDGKKIIIPATCLTDRSVIKVIFSDGKIIEDWMIKEVKRPKDAEVSDFMVTLTSKEGKEHKYSAGEKITIEVITVSDTPDEKITFNYEVVSKKTFGVIKGVEIERITK